MVPASAPASARMHISGALVAVDHEPGERRELSLATTRAPSLPRQQTRVLRQDQVRGVPPGGRARRALQVLHLADAGSRSNFALKNDLLTFIRHLLTLNSAGETVFRQGDSTASGLVMVVDGALGVYGARQQGSGGGAGDACSDEGEGKKLSQDQYDKKAEWPLPFTHLLCPS